MKRLILIVMDSLGIGGAPDASEFGGKGFTDEGSNTLSHIAEARLASNKPLNLPNLAALGLGLACSKSSGTTPAGVKSAELKGGYAFAHEVSRGKDTPSGHWEIAGVPVDFDWAYFPDQPDCFPSDLLSEIGEAAGISGTLGNCHASGTEIIRELGQEHIETELPIFYTSADSVIQIACHEESFGLERLYHLCLTTRRILDSRGLNVGRVIARPFIGTSADEYTRTGNRRDYTVPPPQETVLDKLVDSGGKVIGIGKIADIYAHRGISESIKASGHEALWQETLGAVQDAPDQTLVMTNFVDFDSLYGHRRDVEGYAKALEDFDANLPQLYSHLGPGDLLIITADHGNDPTWQGTDHTRENVPILMYGSGVSPGQFYGARSTFADIGQTAASFFGLPAMAQGTSIL